MIPLPVTSATPAGLASGLAGVDGQPAVHISDDASCTSSDDSDGLSPESLEDEDEMSVENSRAGVSVRNCTDLRRFVWEFLNHDHSLPRWIWAASIVYQLVIAMIVVILFVIDNTGGKMTDSGFFQPAMVTTLKYWVLEMILTVVWSIEYLLRIWSCVEQDAPKMAGSDCTVRRRMMLRPLLLIDILSITSLVVDLCIKSNEYRGISSLRLLTLFRLEREFQLFGPVVMVVQTKGSMLLATLGIAFVILLVGSVTMFYIESPTNEDFSSVLSAMWWCTTALTTVGYGDIYPKSPIGRALGSIVAFLGIGLFAMPAGIIASGFQEMWDAARSDKRKQRRREKRAVTSGNLRVQTAMSTRSQRASSVTSTRSSPTTATNVGSLAFGLDIQRRLELQQEIMAERLETLAGEMAALRAEVRLALAARAG